MKRKLLLLMALILSLPTWAFDGEIFKYTYEGHTLEYEVISEKDKTCRTEHTYPISGDLIIPAVANEYSVIEIGSMTFQSNKVLTSVTIPNTVTKIGEDAFSGCSGLTSVTIPNSVTSIGDSAFEYCGGLTSVTIPNSVTEIGQYTFYGCSGLTSVTIPNSITEIGQGAFRNCSSLASVTIPNSVTSIGDSAFEYCGGLTSVNIPNSVTEIGSACFNKCEALEGFYGKFASEDHRCLIVDGTLNSFAPAGLTYYEIPNSVTSIGSFAFYQCRLTSVDIPNTVTSIGRNAFFNSHLISVTIPNSVTEIGEEAFLSCEYLKELRIPKTVTCYEKNSQSNYLIRRRSSSSSTIATVTIDLHQESFLKIVDETGKEISLKEAATISSDFKYEWDGNTIKFLQLHPKQNAFLHILGMYFGETTNDFGIQINTLETYADSNVVEASYDPGDFEITDHYWQLDNEEKIHQKRANIPYGSKTPCFYIVGDDYIKNSSDISLSFPDPEFTEVDAMATSLSKTRLTAKCNLSTGATASIEWRRDDAPDNVKSKVENCPVVNGTLMGELRGLRDDVYYKFRPFYERDGKKYYGEWVGFYTGDANVYFEPEVGTLPAYISDNNAEVEGYAYPGTDDVSESGIEYRNTGKAGNATRAEAEWIRVAASSSTFFKVRIENLEYNTDYEYRAFAVAGDKTYYGDTAQFSTGNDPSGVECVTADNYGKIKVSLYRNPVVGNPEIIVNAEEETVDCYIYSIAGTLMKKCSVIADGTPQEVEANLHPGMYIVTVSGATGISSLRMIVK